MARPSDHVTEELRRIYAGISELKGTVGTGNIIYLVIAVLGLLIAQLIGITFRELQVSRLSSRV